MNCTVRVNNCVDVECADGEWCLDEFDDYTCRDSLSVIEGACQRVSV